MRLGRSRAAWVLAVALVASSASVTSSEASTNSVTKGCGSTIRVSGAANTRKLSILGDCDNGAVSLYGAANRKKRSFWLRGDMGQFEIAVRGTWRSPNLRFTGYVGDTQVIVSASCIRRTGWKYAACSAYSVSQSDLLNMGDLQVAISNVAASALMR